MSTSMNKTFILYISVLPKRIPLDDGAFCQPSVISYDVTLKGGVKAGSFTPLGQVDSIQTCISLCCQRPSCDVAFMLKTTCYSIKCSNEENCEQVPARASEYSPRLSYVRRYTDNNVTKGEFYEYTILIHGSRRITSASTACNIFFRN